MTMVITTMMMTQILIVNGNGHRDTYPYDEDNEEDQMTAQLMINSEINGISCHA